MLATPRAEPAIADTIIKAIAARLERDHGLNNWEEAGGAKDLANESLLILPID